MAPRKDIEATISSYQNYAKGSVTGSGRNHPYSVVGKTGDAYTAAYDIIDGQSDFTGSRSGVCGVHVTSATNATFHLTGGGSVVVAEIISADGVIVPLAIKQITGADTVIGTVYR